MLFASVCIGVSCSFKKIVFKFCATLCTDEICAIPGVQMKRPKNTVFNHTGKQLHI